jgi:hypothetical protein
MKDMGTLEVGLHNQRSKDDLGATLKKQVEQDGGIPANSQEHKEQVLQSREQVFQSVNAPQVGADGKLTFEIPASRNGKIPAKKVVLREPEGSSQFRATAMLPPNIAGNAQMVQMIQIMLYIESIDGIPVAPPQTFLQAQGLADRIGDEGLTLLNWTLEEAFPASNETQEQAKRIARLRGL